MKMKGKFLKGIWIQFPLPLKHESQTRISAIPLTIYTKQDFSVISNTEAYKYNAVRITRAVCFLHLWSFCPAEDMLLEYHQTSVVLRTPLYLADCSPCSS